MSERKDYKGQIVRIKEGVKHFQVPNFGGSEFRVEDYWDTLTGGSWKDTSNNAACAIYAFRAGLNGLPPDDEVLYGKVGALGHLVHISEIEEIEE